MKLGVTPFCSFTIVQKTLLSDRAVQKYLESWSWCRPETLKMGITSKWSEQLPKKNLLNHHLKGNPSYELGESIRSLWLRVQILYALSWKVSSTEQGWKQNHSVWHPSAPSHVHMWMSIWAQPDSLVLDGQLNVMRLFLGIRKKFLIDRVVWWIAQPFPCPVVVWGM